MILKEPLSWSRKKNIVFTLSIKKACHRYLIGGLTEKIGCRLTRDKSFCRLNNIKEFKIIIQIILF